MTPTWSIQLSPQPSVDPGRDGAVDVVGMQSRPRRVVSSRSSVRGDEIDVGLESTDSEAPRHERPRVGAFGVVETSRVGRVIHASRSSNGSRNRTAPRRRRLLACCAHSRLAT